jgi:hypothetical protein
MKKTGHRVQIKTGPSSVWWPEGLLFLNDEAPEA